MPYSIRKSGGKFKVVNTESGKTKGTHTSRAKAQKQVNLLRGVESGEWKPTGKKAKKHKSSTAPRQTALRSGGGRKRFFLA